MIKKIEFFAYILILLLPISLITGPAIPDLSITLIGIYFIGLIIIKKQYQEIFTKKWVIISICFWLFLIFISLFSENKYLAYRDSIIFIRYLLIPIFMYFWLITDHKGIKKIIFIIFLSVSFVMIDTIYQFTNYDPPTGFGKDLLGFIPKSEFYGRLSGPFENLVPGSYVSKFALIGMVFIFLHFKNESLQKSLSIFYLSIAGIVTYISGERMALATFILGICILIIFMTKKRIIFISTLVIIFCSCFIITKIHPIYNDYNVIESSPYHLGLKIEKIYKCKNNQNIDCKKILKLQPEFHKVIQNFHQSSYGQIYSLALKMWVDHPFQGIGLNNYYFLCKNDKRYTNSIKQYVSSDEYKVDTECVSHPHNYYIQWLSETGVFGLLFFLIYIISIFYFIAKNKLNPFLIIALTTLIILFWPIMSTGSLLKNWTGVSTFYLIGICLSLIKIKKDPIKLNN